MNDRTLILPPPQRVRAWLGRGPWRAIAVLFVINFTLLGLGFWGLFREVSTSNQIRCTSLEQLISIPIPRPIKGHESRTYEARVRRVDEDRARALGCHLGKEPAP